MNWKDLPNPTQAEIEEAGIGYFGDGRRTAEYVMLLKQKKVRQSHEIKSQSNAINELQERVTTLESSLQWIADTKIHTWTNADDGIRQIQNKAQNALQNISINSLTIKELQSNVTRKNKLLREMRL